MSRTPVNIGVTPKVGEHNDQVLSEILGYSQEEIAAFKQANVISEEGLYPEVQGAPDP